MTETDKQAPGGNGLTAAEYVLGVLDADQRGEAERRIARDAVFAREVAFWEEKLGGLAATVTTVEPPAGAWARIEAALASERRRGAAFGTICRYGALLPLPWARSRRPASPR